MNLDFDIRPATVIPEVSCRLARSIIDNNLKDIVAGLGERRGGDSFAVGKHRQRRAERDLARPPILEPFLTETWTSLRLAATRSGDSL
jgi:hypothetical protein